MADIAAAWIRAERVLRRRPKTGLQIDAPATARWQKGTRILCTHPSGATVATDMPAALGGDGTEVTPGWLARAAHASCTATLIAMIAQVEGIELELLEVVVSSKSDLRGVIGVADEDGNPVDPCPLDVQLRVRITASQDIPQQRLRALVERANRSSPVSRTLQAPIPVELIVDCAGL